MNKIGTHKASRRRFHQVAESIKRMIEEEGLRDGDQLPTERDLSLRFKVAVLTIRRANQELEELGVIRREWGRGTFVGAKTGSASGGARPGAGKSGSNVGYLSVRSELAGAHFEYFQGLSRRLAKAGHRLVFELAQAQTDRSDLLNWVERQNLSAVVAQGHLDLTTLGMLTRLGVPALVAGNAPGFPGVATVAPDLASFSAQVVRTLRTKLGFDHVWIVIEPLRLHMSRLLLERYSQAVGELNDSIELVSLCDDGGHRSFVDKFKKLQPALGGRHAIFWTYPHPFVPATLFATSKRQPAWQVVNFGRRLPGWFLPAENDLGMLLDAAAEYGDATYDLIVETLLRPDQPGRNRVIAPVVSVGKGSDGGARLEVAWQIKELAAGDQAAQGAGSGA